MRLKILSAVAVVTFCLLLDVGCGGVPQSAPVSVAAPRISVQVAQPNLSASPAALTFSTIEAGQSSTLALEVANTGGDATITAMNASSSAFRIVAPATPFQLKGGYRITVQVTFAPSTAGDFQAKLSLVISGARTLSVPLSASALSPAATSLQHHVQLAWSASSSVVDGYNVYRSEESSGLYTRVNSSPVAATNFDDATVVSGHTYYYVVTAVAEGLESGYSPQTAAVIPSP